jgi:hypothetical protein
MMKSYIKLMLFYFGYEIIYNGIMPILFNIFNWSGQNDANMDAQPGLRQHFFDMIIVSSLLVIFRPRVWPPMFGVGIIDD